MGVGVGVGVRVRVAKPKPEPKPEPKPKPLAQVASGGRGSVVLTHKGEVFTWVAAPQAKATQQQPAAALTRVDALSPFTVSRVATSGQVLLASARVRLRLRLRLRLRGCP